MFPWFFVILYKIRSKYVTQIFLYNNFLGLGLSFSFGQQTHYEERLKKMLLVSGSANAYTSSIVKMFDLLKTQYPEKDFKPFEEAFVNQSIEHLTQMMTPFYKEHFSTAELELMIGFYESPVGKKLIEKAPLIVQKSLEIGQQWGVEVGQKLQKLIAD